MYVQLKKAYCLTHYSSGDSRTMSMTNVSQTKQLIEGTVLSNGM